MTRSEESLGTLGGFNWAMTPRALAPFQKNLCAVYKFFLNTCLHTDDGPLLVHLVLKKALIK